MAKLKLFMVLLGCKPPGRHTEQHDVFFGIARNLNELAPAMKAFWPGPERIHVDAWREVKAVEGFEIRITERIADNTQSDNQKRLFFVNLGGYLPNRFEEQHYIVLTIKDNKAAAFKTAKETLFYKENGFKGATSHIDDQYGIDVDDLYQIEEMLNDEQKAKYAISAVPAEHLPADPMHLGYLKMSQLESTTIIGG
jgi:hypothetical protein